MEITIGATIVKLPTTRYFFSRHNSRLSPPKKTPCRDCNSSLLLYIKKDEELVGYVSYFNYNPLNRSAELGILIAPEERKKGYAKDAIKTLTRYLFLYHGLNKVYVQTAHYNKGAKKLLEKLGFQQDAALRNHYYHDGEFHTGYIYSLLLFEFE